MVSQALQHLMLSNAYMPDVCPKTFAIRKPGSQARPATGKSPGLAWQSEAKQSQEDRMNAAAFVPRSNDKTRNSVELSSKAEAGSGQSQGVSCTTATAIT